MFFFFWICNHTVEFFLHGFFIQQKRLVQVYWSFPKPFISKLACEEAALEPEWLSRLLFDIEEVLYRRCTGCAHHSVSLVPYPCGHLYCWSCSHQFYTNMANVNPSQCAHYQFGCPGGCTLKRPLKIFRKEKYSLAGRKF